MQCCVLQGSELSELSDSVGFPHTFSHNQPGQSRAAGQCQQREGRLGQLRPVRLQSDSATL